MGAQGAVNILHRQHLRRTQEEGGDVAGERSKLETEYENLFATPLDDWKAGRFEDGLGTEVWQGQMDVAAPVGGGARPVNEEVASRIDLRQAGLVLDPGVYVLNATVPVFVAPLTWVRSATARASF